MLLGATSVALVAWGLAACGAARPQPGKIGQPCEGTEHCVSGLECKAAQCAPPLSARGGVCVTDKGCAAPLTCLRGRCSTGRATRAQCTAACAHVTELMAVEMRAGQPPPPQGRAMTQDEQLVELSIADFELRCFKRCVENGATLEEVACLSDARTILQVRACP